MASVEKFTDAAVTNQLRHNAREIITNSNKDIDKARTHLNYSLTPERSLSPRAYYAARKKELYVYGRKDVKTMAGWIITAPKELSSKQEEQTFFQSVYNFLENRYGKENVIQATVHYDEGKKVKSVDRWGKVLTDDEGKPIYKIAVGRPHLHFDFIPEMISGCTGINHRLCAIPCVSAIMKYYGKVIILYLLYYFFHK